VNDALALIALAKLAANIAVCIRLYGLLCFGLFWGKKAA
jgi:hypothetical protein